MLRNYIKTALRSLIKQKIYTLINVLGLAVSITACVLIVLYVRHEVSYDTFFLRCRSHLQDGAGKKVP
ncbi:MAG: ABC transporter permease [Bacteroidota bacterium]